MQIKRSCVQLTTQLSSSAAMYPDESTRARSRNSPPIRRAAFFPLGLDPVLDRGKGEEHAVVPPEMPTGDAEGHAVLGE
jgi:hypothetical protein